jgi:hypothetical protein
MKKRSPTATAIWERTNIANLEENILPTRPRATLILKKGAITSSSRWRCGGSNSFFR